MLQRAVSISDRNDASTEICLLSCHDQGHDKRNTCMYTIYHSEFKLDGYSVKVVNHSLSERFFEEII